MDASSTYEALHVMAQTVDEAIQLENNLSDGRRVVKLMYDRTFVTPVGSCKMNSNGDRENVYAIMGVSSQTANQQVI